MLMLSPTMENDLAARCSAAPGLKSARLRRVLSDLKFTEELGHLLRRAPALNSGSHDAGLACRDSAVLVACMAAALGHTVQICSGETALIGPLEDTAQTGQPGYLHLDVHSWVDIDKFGICDLSPDLSIHSGFGWMPWPVKYLVGSRYVPNATPEVGRYCVDGQVFAKAIDQAITQPQSFRSIYFEKARQPFTNMLFIGAVNFALSPLLKELSAQPYFSLNILGKAAVHLRRVMKGKAGSLRGLSQPAAWAEIARITDAAVEKLRTRLLFADDAALSISRIAP